MRILVSYIRRNARWLALEIATPAIMLLVIELNGVPFSEWKYGLLLCLFLLLAIGGADYWKYYKRHKELSRLQSVITVSPDALKSQPDVIEQDYRTLLHLLYDKKEQEVNALKRSRKDMTEYYTMWIHQIKTPIAAMRLLLAAEDTGETEELSAELFRIEQYVEMALQYLRLDSDSTDYVIRRISLDAVVKEAVHKYARQFVRKKIRLDFKPLDAEVLSDEKWLEFVIEQLLSNALKYTTKGSISIYMEQDEEKTLVIEDTGIGIREEDLPRVLEKGYTGYNGHGDKRSTGIGLYLCNRILTRLGHTIRLESEVGVGTRVMVGLAAREYEQE